MSEETNRKRLETEALVVGYAMSRFDRRYLLARGAKTWRAAYAEASNSLGVPSSSLKNLRDEFDPFHGSIRKGWRLRSLRPSRQRVLDDLAELGDDALFELVERIMVRDTEATNEAIDFLAAITKPVCNVAQRLLTGRKAEEYFIRHCFSISGVSPDEIIDDRNSARGYDFGVSGNPQLAIEIKGLKLSKGEIQFTDREWREASYRRDNYWLVVVGQLDSVPKAELVVNPFERIPATCSYQTSITASWRTRFALR